MQTEAVTAIKITDHKTVVPGGYELVSGWALMDANGRLYSSDGVRPYCHKLKRVAKEIEASGLLPGFKTVTA